MHAERSNRGFTLVEALVVVAILGAAFLLMPNFVEMIRGTQLEQTGREASVLLKKARLMAIKQSAPAVVEIDGNFLFAFLDRSNPPNSNFDDGDEEIGRIEIRRGVTASTIAPDPGDSTPYQAEFTSTGSVLNRGAFVFQDPSGEILKVEIRSKAAGHIELVK